MPGTNAMMEMDTTGLPPEVAEQAERVKRFMEGLDTGATGEASGEGTTAANADQSLQSDHAQPPGENRQQATDLAAVMSGGQNADNQQQADGQQQATSDDTAEQRYRVLQGIHRADVNRLTGRIKELEAELERLRGSGQRSAGEDLSASGQDSDIDPAGDLDDQLEAARLEGNYDLIKRLRSRIRERDRSELRQELRQEFEPVIQQVTNSTDDRYATDLNALAAGWEQIRDNPEFAVFLQQSAPFTSTPLFDLLNEADQARDAVRVSEIYNAFRQYRPAATSQGQQRTLPASLTAPNRSAAAGGPTPQPKIITAEQLQEAASDVGKGLITAEDYVALQNQFYQQTVFKQ